MRLYLDDDMASALLARLLRDAGNDVQLPLETEMSGASDPVHLAYCMGQGRCLLSGNHDDFLELHDLIMHADGHHPGILIVRRDNNPKRDLIPKGIVQTVQNLESSGVEIENHFHILNHWK